MLESTLSTNQPGVQYVYLAGERIDRSHFANALVQLQFEGLVRIGASIIRVPAMSFIDMRVVGSFELINSNQITVVEPDDLRALIPIYGFMLPVIGGQTQTPLSVGSTLRNQHYNGTSGVGQ